METILVLTDFSDAAFNAARYAAAFTHQLDASRRLLYHSYEFVPPVETAVPLYEPVNVSSFHQDSIEKLSELKDQIRTFVKDGTDIDIIADERPIIKAAEAIGMEYLAGLLVMGVTGKS